MFDVSPQNLEFFFQLVLAATLGALMGVEREIARKTAGMRTFALVSMGSCLFSIISVYGVQMAGFSGAINFDPTRMAAQIIAGVGFIGAGLIIFNQEKLQGVTTAAGLWLAAAIGVGVGYKFYLLSAFAAFIALFVFTFLWHVEEKILKRYASRPDA